MNKRFWKKIGKALLFPPLLLRIVLIPVAAVLLTGSMILLGSDSPVSCTAYALSAYTLTVWCLQIPRIVRSFKTFRNQNKYALLWRSNPRLRVGLSLYGSLLWNAAYALLQLGLALWHRSFWDCALGGYYLSLAVMRFFLANHTRKHRPGERMREELRKYRACGIAFLLMNLALSLMIFFMVYWNRTFHHHEITAIAMAAYTFTAVPLAVVNAVKYKKYNSPVYSASKAISLAAACVSLITLESTLLTTFGDETMDLTQRRILLGTTGAAISAFILTMAIYMIVRGTKKIRRNTAEKENLYGIE